jgi:hypothetical protein
MSIPPRFDRAIARWTACFILEGPGITADEAALALSAAKGVGRPQDSRAGRTLRQLATSYRLSAVAATLGGPARAGRLIAASQAMNDSLGDARLEAEGGLKLAGPFPVLEGESRVGHIRRACLRGSLSAAVRMDR